MSTRLGTATAGTPTCCVIRLQPHTVAATSVAVAGGPAPLWGWYERSAVANPPLGALRAWAASLGKARWSRRSIAAWRHSWRRYLWEQTVGDDFLVSLTRG